VAYDYDPVGPLAGQRYDAATLTKADGKGQWWDGLDPQDLYVGRTSLAAPDGITSIAAMNKWHAAHDGKWWESANEENVKFAKNWFLRCKDLIDKYHPDQLYFDDESLPLGQYGLDITAHMYNSSIAQHGGVNEAVVNAKRLKPEHRGALVEDYERGAANRIMPYPWQTDTCIGSWHYDKSIFEKHRYKTVSTVVGILVDVVSKNGNLMLNIPLKGDGTIDSDEEAFLHGLADWMKVNGEGLFGSRPWKISGEGKPKAAGGMFNEGKLKYTADDLRFTTKAGKLYIYVMGEPTQDTTVRSLAKGAKTFDTVTAVRLLGSDSKVEWKQTDEGLMLPRPEKMPSKDAIAYEVTLSKPATE
jgi:alpha-L-fucosidase